MSMSTWAKGICPPDRDWMKMKAVWDACDQAGVDLPKEVEDFFDGRPPDEKGVVIDIKDAIREWSADMQQGLEVDIHKLPKNVKIVRFVNCW